MFSVDSEMVMQYHIYIYNYTYVWLCVDNSTFTAINWQILNLLYSYAFGTFLVK